MRHPNRYILSCGVEVSLSQMHSAPQSTVEAIAERHGPVMAAELLGMWSEHVRTTTPEHGISAAEKWARYHRILAACRTFLYTFEVAEAAQ